MELKKGYKQTEVGIIPNDWHVVSLGDLFDFKNGLNKEKIYFGTGTPIVNYMDVYKGGGINSKNLKGKVTITKEEIKNYSVRKGDVFFTRTSETIDEIGLTNVILEELQNTVFSGFVLRARPINDMLDLLYKKYCFSSIAVRKEIVSKSTYTTRALINGKSLSKVLIGIPLSLSEQSAIGQALSDTDSLIKSIENLIAKKRLVKQAAMQQLFTPKEGWKPKIVSEFGQIVTGSTPLTHEKEYWGGTIPWATPTDISTRKELFDTDRKITQQGLNTIRKLPANSILVTCIASIGKNAILKKAGACNQQINAIIPSDKYDPDFLYYLFETAKKYMLGKAGITATLMISKKEFEQLTFYVPCLKEQMDIANALSDMDIEITALEAKLAKYRQIKQGMMQNLLTGKIRLM